ARAFATQVAEHQRLAGLLASLQAGALLWRHALEVALHRLPDLTRCRLANGLLARRSDDPIKLAGDVLHDWQGTAEDGADPSADRAADRSALGPFPGADPSHQP